jgi:hypothetical protein
MTARRIEREAAPLAGGSSPSVPGDRGPQRGATRRQSTKQPCLKGHTMRELIESLSSMLNNVLESGFELPVHVAVIGCNGAFITATYERRNDELTTTIHSATGGDLKAPLNVVFVDSHGEAARTVIEKDRPLLQ